MTTEQKTIRAKVGLELAKQLATSARFARCSDIGAIASTALRNLYGAIGVKTFFDHFVAWCVRGSGPRPRMTTACHRP
jgi:hypothetical protein